MGYVTLPPSALEIILILHELHNRGYEQLRLLPGMSASGCYWRWAIYPKFLMWDDNSFEKHGDIITFKHLEGSTEEERPRSESLITAEQFIRGNENFIELAKAKDKAYIKWFDQIVEHAKKDDFPIAYSDYFSAEEWKFMSGEPLSYPPFTRATFDEIDAKAIQWARENNLF